MSKRTTQIYVHRAIIKWSVWGLLLFSHSLLVSATPLYPNSVVSNDLEFITTSDPTVGACLQYLGREKQEMPDKRTDRLFIRGVYTYIAKFADGEELGIWVNPKVGNQQAALEVANKVLGPLGKLPEAMRNNIDHVVIHDGDESAFGEADGYFFVLYADNMATRIANHDLEETVFHESVHAALDQKYSKSKAWRKAVKADRSFITNYAKRQPSKEDFAESALFAWALIVHPGRLPPKIEAAVNRIMPNRLAYFEELGIFTIPSADENNIAPSC